MPRRDFTTANVVATGISLPTSTGTSPRLSRRAGLLHVPQRRLGARVGPIRVLGAMGHQGRRRRMGRAEGVSRERAGAVHDRQRRDDPAGRLRLRGSAVQLHDAERVAAAHQRRLSIRHLLRRHAHAADSGRHLERVALSSSSGGDYQLTPIALRAARKKDTIHLARVRIRTALNTQASGNAFVQYNSTIVAPRCQRAAPLQRRRRHGLVAGLQRRAQHGTRIARHDSPLHAALVVESADREVQPHAQLLNADHQIASTMLRQRATVPLSI